MQIPVYIYMIFVCLLASLAVIFRPTRKLYLRLFPFFLLITLIVELIGNYLSYYNRNNQLLYSSFGSFENTFYFFVLSQVVTSKLVKKILLHLLWIYPILFILNVSFIQTGGFASYTHAFACLIIVPVCIFYFYELFQLPYSIDLIREPSFWICSGLLFFYCCSFPIVGSVNLLLSLPRFILDNIDTIINIINVSLYSLLTIALLCRIRIRKSI